MDDEVRAALDEVKAAIFVLTDRLAQAIQALEATTSGLQAAVQEIKQQQQPRRQEIVLPPELLSLPAKLDAVIASQAKISSQLEGVAHACSQLPLQVEASAGAVADTLKQASEAMPPAISSEHVEAFKGAVDATLDEKLSRLAQLEAELLAQARKNSESLEAVAAKLGSSPESEEELRAQDQLSRVQKMLEKVIENQNKQNEVLAEALGALLDAVSHVKARVDLLPTQAELEKDVEQDIAKKIGGQ